MARMTQAQRKLAADDWFATLAMNFIRARFPRSMFVRWDDEDVKEWALRQNVDKLHALVTRARYTITAFKEAGVEE